MKASLPPLVLGAGAGILVAGVLAVILTLADGCYEGDPGYGLPGPGDGITETLAKSDGALE